MFSLGFIFRDGHFDLAILLRPSHELLLGVAKLNGCINLRGFGALIRCTV